MTAVGARSRYSTKTGRSGLHSYLLDFEYRDVSSSNFHILVIDSGHSKAVEVGERLYMCNSDGGPREQDVAAPGAAPRALATGMFSRAHYSPGATSVL